MILNNINTLQEIRVLLADFFCGIFFGGNMEIPAILFYRKFSGGKYVHSSGIFGIFGGFFLNKAQSAGNKHLWRIKKLSVLWAGFLNFKNPPVVDRCGEL